MSVTPINFVDLPSETPAGPGLQPDHDVHIYTSDDSLVATSSRFLGVALAAGDAALLVATPAHRVAILRRIKAHGFDLARLVKRGRLLALDASQALSEVSTAGEPDPAKFAEFFGSLVRRLHGASHRRQGRVVVLGEMVALLMARGRPAAAVALERLWSGLSRTHGFALRCAYPADGLSRERGHTLAEIFAEHSRLIPLDHPSANHDSSLAQLPSEQQGLALRSAAEERRRLAAELAGEVENLRHLHEVSMRVTRLDRQEAMEQILASVVKLHETHMGLLSLVDPETSELRIRASLGLAQDFLDLVERLRPGAGACGACMQRRERVIIEDVERDEVFVEYRRAAARAGFRAVHSTPLLNRAGQLIGVLSVHFPAPYRPSEQQVRFTDLFAGLASNAIENAQLYCAAKDEIQRRTQAERALEERIAELRRAHSALLEAERLAATGRLAATIAHEINNPLEAITNLFYLLDRLPGMPEEGRAYTSQCSQELQRVAHIVKEILGFYRSAGPVLVSVGDAVRSALAVSARQLELRGIRVHAELDCDQRVLAREGELRQIFLNLLGNAIQATPTGGRLRVRVRPAVAWNRRAQRGVRITIADTGRGISREHRPHVFEPFFSTKAEKGTGLGLWVTKGIVQKHCGSIRFRTRVGDGSGTCFTVFLPDEGGAGKRAA